MNFKRYGAIVFDWDGTAGISRSSPADEVIPLITGLLEKGVYLDIISGTTYEKIDSGKLHKKIPADALSRLYMGLGGFLPFKTR